MTTAIQDWSKPQPVTQLEFAFGGDMAKLLPPMDVVPDEFRQHRNPYVRAVATWFYRGLDSSTLQAKPGVDRKTALGHLGAILGSFEPAHEHKEAGAAYLMSLWFDLT